MLLEMSATATSLLCREGGQKDAEIVAYVVVTQNTFLTFNLT